MFELGDDGEYARIAEVTGPEMFDATNPFPVRVVPSGLTSRSRRA
ncbi:hypothetical protein [Saccharopolyspora rhizosphaerae]|nr:hypothetical protein [Saccharopolyspora rhizosphaerae]